ncbi:hypothetical protein JKP88DRAFT_267124 [Tribonema minus]|uniref:Metaxin n=1 Tax=Tribonema minus TaxID=303371 RepID=A0A835ZEI3_9STRA|nr:hypothetical protein JKP88DRAFT_267124 [Tribonema minus]
MAWWWGAGNSFNAESLLLQSFNNDKSCQSQVRLGNASSNPPVLIQFRPAWTEQAYLRFSGIPHRLENSRFASSEVTGTYPQLQDGHFLLPGGAIVQHLTTYRRDLDSNLTGLERADAVAFAAVVKDVLAPLLEAIRWSADERDVRRTVERPMRRALPPPLRYVVPWLESRAAIANAAAACGHSNVRGSQAEGRDEKGVPLEQLLESAKRHYAALNARLGDKAPYFFGAAPCTLDAIVFGHLAAALADVTLAPVVPQFFNNVVASYFCSDMAACHPARIDSNDVEVFTPAMARANAVNAENTFNQLSGCAICAQAAPAPDPFQPYALRNPALVAPQRAAAAASAGGTPAKQGKSSKWSTAAWTAGAAITFILYGAMTLSIVEVVQLSAEDDDDAQ